MAALIIIPMWVSVWMPAPWLTGWLSRILPNCWLSFSHYLQKRISCQMGKEVEKAAVPTITSQHSSCECSPCNPGDLPTTLPEQWKSFKPFSNTWEIWLLLWKSVNPPSPLHSSSPSDPKEFRTKAWRPSPRVRLGNQADVDLYPGST